MVIEFTQHGNGRLRAAIDMSKVEAVLERERGGCVVVTATDTYHLANTYLEVVVAWGRNA